MALSSRIPLVCIGLGIAVAAFAQGTPGPGMPAAPEHGGPRDWEVTGVSRALNLRAQPALGAQVIASYTPGTILDNLAAAWGIQGTVIRARPGVPGAWCVLDE